MKKILIYSEAKDGIVQEYSYELISKAKELCNHAKESFNIDISITTALVGHFVREESVKRALSAGSENFVLIKNDDFREFNQILYSRAFLSYFFENSHDYILFPASPTGRIVAPRVTTALNTGLVADCTGLDLIIKNNEIKLGATRPTFGAELMATILSRKSPECATIRPKTFKAEFKYEPRGIYNEYPCSISSDKEFKIIDSTNDKEKKFDLSSSKVILAAGFGLYDGKDNEYVNKLEKLAGQIKADFAVSRKLVDLKVRSSEFQIGQTGSTATPDLYVAFGISGAIQHIQGMKNSKTIVAVNQDPEAEIFKYCDYKIVADAREVIDGLMGKIG